MAEITFQITITIDAHSNPQNLTPWIKLKHQEKNNENLEKRTDAKPTEKNINLNYILSYMNYIIFQKKEDIKRNASSCILDIGDL